MKYSLQSAMRMVRTQLGRSKPQHSPSCPQHELVERIRPAASCRLVLRPSEGIERRIESYKVVDQDHQQENIGGRDEPNQYL